MFTHNPRIAILVFLTIAWSFFLLPLPIQGGTIDSDEVERALLGESGKKKSSEVRHEDEKDALEKQLRRELGNAAEKEEENPVLDVARRMFDIQKRLADSDVGESVQKQQEQIVASLDQLIEKAKQSGSCSSSSSNPQQNPEQGAKGKEGKTPAGTKPSENPANKSTPRLPENKKTGKTDQADMQNKIKALWGELPQHAREQMMQNPVESFVPKYETMLEEYYRRLSEGRE